MTERKDHNLESSARKAVETAIREDALSRVSIKAHVRTDPERKDWYNDPTIKNIHAKMKLLFNKGWINPATHGESSIPEAAGYCTYKADQPELAALRRFWNQSTALIVQQLRRSMLAADVTLAESKGVGAPHP
jgi:hypothetical protein